MKRLVSIFLYILLFGAGWAIGAQGYRNAAGWSALSSIERLMYTSGYSEGYIRGSLEGSIVAAGLLAEKNKGLTTTLGKIDPAKLERLQLSMRAQAGTGRNQHMNTIEVQKGIDTFYGDFRNQSICWYDAFKFSAMALNGDTPTEKELSDARESGAKNCLSLEK